MEKGKKLPCGHIFHMDCLRMWLQHQQSCPLCRADIPVTATGTRPRVNPNAAAEAAMAVPLPHHPAPAPGTEFQAALHAALARGDHLRGEGGRTAHANDTVTFPCFFVVTAEPSLDVRAEASMTASVVRTVVPVS
jgi:hypothetical protein